MHPNQHHTRLTAVPVEGRPGTQKRSAPYVLLVTSVLLDTSVPLDSPVPLDTSVFLTTSALKSSTLGHVGCAQGNSQVGSEYRGSGWARGMTLRARPSLLGGALLAAPKTGHTAPTRPWCGSPRAPLHPHLVFLTLDGRPTVATTLLRNTSFVAPGRTGEGTLNEGVPTPRNTAQP